MARPVRCRRRAGAALAGLVFVAVSINIERILKLPGTPERALQTVLLLIGVVVTSLFGLIPQAASTFAVELLLTTVGLAIGMAITGRAVFRASRGHFTWTLSRLALIVPGTGLYAVAGITLLAGAGGGLYWAVAGMISAIISGVLNAWVLMVEILR